MRILLILGLAAVVVRESVAPPVSKTKSDEDLKNKENELKQEPLNMEDTMEYHRYLKEVVQALESDPEFRAKLDKAEEVDIRTGKIAHELEFVSHQVRSKLDELKRQELERLRHLAIKEYELEKGLNVDHLKIAEHLDHENPHTFEIDDLKKLIAKTTQDLVEADKRRRQEFKEYEMQKKFEEQEKMKGLDEEHKKKYEEELKQLKEKHKKHDPLHHPGSKQQLEEVWEKQDHMDRQDFDPKTFFYLHDLDGNGVWDPNEGKALFLKELDKLYAQGAPEDDLRERAEEMELMREHLFNESDLNKDGLISYFEFLEQTKKQEFQQDEGWETLDERQVYTQEEYEAFERQRQEEIQKMIAKGMLPPHPEYSPGDPHQFPPQYANAHQGGGVPHHDYQNQQQFQGQPMHPQQQQYQGQQGQFHGQVPQQQYHAQVPQQHYQGQVPQQPPYQGQVPQQPQYQGQVHQPQYQGQAPQQPYQGQVYQQPYQGQAPQQPYQGQAPQQPYQGQAVPQQQHPNQAIPQQPQQGQAVPQQQQQQQPQQGQAVPQQQQQQPPQQGQAVPQQQQPQQGQAVPQQQQQQQPQQGQAVPQQQQQQQQQPQGQAPQQPNHNQAQQSAQQPASNAIPNVGKV